MYNARVSFEHLNKNVINRLKWKTNLIYLGEIIIFGISTSVSNESLVPRFVDSLKEVRYLRHIIWNQKNYNKGHQDQEHHRLSNTKWPIQIRTSYYHRRYVLKNTTIAKLLTTLTEETRTFLWNQKCQVVFEKFKVVQETLPILGYSE